MVQIPSSLLHSMLEHESIQLLDLSMLVCVDARFEARQDFGLSIRKQDPSATPLWTPNTIIGIIFFNFFNCFFFKKGPFPASFPLFLSFHYTVDSKQMFNI